MSIMFDFSKWDGNLYFQVKSDFWNTAKHFKTSENTVLAEYNHCYTLLRIFLRIYSFCQMRLQASEGSAVCFINSPFSCHYQGPTLNRFGGVWGWRQWLYQFWPRCSLFGCLFPKEDVHERVSSFSRLGMLNLVPGISCLVRVSL